MVTHANLHYTVLKNIVEHGYAPAVEKLSHTLQVSFRLIRKD